MQKLLLVSTLSLSALAVATLPAQAQFVSIPISNGNFALTNAGYTTLPTFLSPAGTVNLTAAAAGSTVIWSPAGGVITTNTPAGADLLNTSGSVNLNDGRTASFTNTGRVNVRGLASITGADSWAIPANNYLFANTMPAGATVTFTNATGQINIPAASLSNYPAPQFTIPVTGGTFTVNDTSESATITINSLLTPVGTANLTVTLPTLVASGGTFVPNATPQPISLGGIANGTVALNTSQAVILPHQRVHGYYGTGTVAPNDGRVATVSDRMITLQGTATLTVAPPPGPAYLFNTARISGSATITGTLTGGTINVPESAVAVPPPPVQPPVVPPSVVPPVQSPVVPSVQLPVVPSVQLPVVPPAPLPQRQEFVLGFAPGLNLGGDPDAYLPWEAVEQRPITPEDLPEVEQSALAFSRIHPGCNSYTR